MGLDKKVLSDIQSAFKKSKTFFIAGHLNPDGDTVGTALALFSLLSRMGKQVKVYSKDPIPESLQYVPGVQKIFVTDTVRRSFDCAIILECLDLHRMGDLITPEQAKIIINIDHHANFNHFGHINYIDSSASSSAEMVYNIFTGLDVRITPQEANALYIGLVTDTGRFQYNNTTAAALHMAYSLVKIGVKPSVIYKWIYATKPLSYFNLLGAALSTLKVSASKKIAHMEITGAMLKKAGSKESETEGIINYAIMIPGVAAGLLFRENTQKNVVKVSFRSHKEFSINKIAQYFGGGGHKNAAGCTYKGSMSQAKKEILRYVERKLLTFNPHAKA